MSNDVKLNIEEMIKAGVNFGHTVSKLHPKMKPFVSGVKNNVHLIDLEKSIKEFESSLKFIASLVKENKTILFVGTKIQAKESVKKTAQDCNMPYVVERWLGGTLTNFETLTKRIDYFLDLEDKKARNALEKYTKKERLNFDKELETLKIKFEGIKRLRKLPDAIFILDLKKDLTAAKEAKKKGIKIIGVVDTNINPDIADYIIPANDDAISSIEYVLESVKETILNSRV
ncbi:MAG: 30S ribosomal protein S2 [Candidatus Staskawiczbacteria bacterium]|nr:30S ribosomal protein S2 [Candidatus Staskawiczbacteria bacterium]